MKTCFLWNSLPNGEIRERGPWLELHKAAHICQKNQTFAEQLRWAGPIHLHPQFAHEETESQSRRRAVILAPGPGLWVQVRASQTIEDEGLIFFPPSNMSWTKSFCEL